MRPSSLRLPRLPRSSAALLAACACALLVATATARGRGNDIPVRIDYRAPAGCGQEATFMAKLAARVPHVRAASATEPAPQLVVHVTRTGRGVHGRLSLEEEGGAQSSRDVDGDTCESVERALVLVAALALDPSSVAGGGDGTTAPSAPDGGASGSADGGAGAAGNLQGDAVAPPVEAGPTDRARDEGPQKPALDARDGWHFGAGAGVLVTSGSAPSAVLGVPVFIDLARGVEASIWSPSLRLGFEYDASGNQAVANGAVRFVGELATLEACPLRVLAGPLRFSPCVRAEAGVVDASGVGVVPARSETRPWVAVGALARVRYVPVSPLFLELWGGARAALQRDRFYFEPDETVFRPPLFSAFASATVGVTIL